MVRLNTAQRKCSGQEYIDRPLNGVVRVGTRTSALALWQTGRFIEEARIDQARQVAKRAEQIFPNRQFRIQEISTSGDRDQRMELHDPGLFTDDLDGALIRGSIDVAVHSLKDLPGAPHPDILHIPVMQRESPDDVLVTRDGSDLNGLPQAARIGTCSVRRSLQLKLLRPDVEVTPLRGAVPERLRKLYRGDYDAVVLAAAGLIRLGRISEATQHFSFQEIVPAAGQGALAVSCRRSDRHLQRWLRKLQPVETAVCATAERHLQFLLESPGQLVVGAVGEPIWNSRREHPSVRLLGRLLSFDGVVTITDTESGSDPLTVASRLAQRLSRKFDAQRRLHRRQTVEGRGG